MMRRWMVALLLLCVGAPAEAAQVQEVVSSGGLKAWLIEDHSLPMVAVHVAFEGAGYAYDPAGEEGRANLVASMLSEGAGDLDSQRFNEALDAQAMQWHASLDEEVLEVQTAFISEHASQAFSLLGKALTAPRFDNDAIDRVRRQMIAAVVYQESTPGYRMAEAWRKRVYGKHPYARPMLGTEAGLRSLGRSDLQQFAERFLARENAVIAVVGDITPAALKTLMNEHLSALPERYKPDTTVAKMAIAPSGREPASIDFDIPQTLIMFGGPGIERADPDYMAAHVLNHIIGGEGGLSSRLGMEIREKRGLSYGAYTALRPLAHGPSWGGHFATRNEQARAALAVLMDTLEHVSAKGVSERELADAKAYLTGSFALSLDTNSELAGFLINMQRHKLGMDYMERRNALVRAVTRDAVNQMAARIVDPRAMTVVMVGKPALKEPVKP